MPESEPKRGLHGKYRVEKNGEPVEDCFVLEPAEDSAAREALRQYADATENDKLASDLRAWLSEMQRDPNGENDNNED